MITTEPRRSAAGAAKAYWRATIKPLRAPDQAPDVPSIEARSFSSSY
jgi:hypothetical protein